jgi:hypothetical protein
MSNQSVCRMHGGSAPRALAAAHAREVERRALNALPKDVEPMGNPLRVLLQTATRAELFTQAVEQLVVDLNGRDGTLIRYRDDHGAEQLRSEIAVYERALDRLAKITESIVRLGIDEHLARVEARAVELRGEHMDTLLRRVLQALGHDPDDPGVAQVVVDEIDRLWGDL